MKLQGIGNEIPEGQKPAKPQQGQGRSRAVERIEQQIQRVMEEKQKLSGNDNEMDPQQKVKRIQALEKELQDLQKQLTQAQMAENEKENAKKLEEIKEAAETSKSPVQKEKEAEEAAKGISSHEMQALLEVGSSMSEAKSINKVRVKLSGQAHALKGTIAQASTRGDDVSGMEAQLGGLESKIGQVTESMMSKYGNAMKAMKNAQGETIEQADIKTRKEEEQLEKDKLKKQEEENQKKQETAVDIRI